MWKPRGKFVHRVSRHATVIAGEVARLLETVQEADDEEAFWEWWFVQVQVIAERVQMLRSEGTQERDATLPRPLLQ